MNYKDDIIQIGDEYFRIFQVKEISTLDKISEQIRKQRDIYDRSEFYKLVVRKVVGDEKKIYLGPEKGMELAWIVAKETRIKGGVDVLHFYL